MLWMQDLNASFITIVMGSHRLGILHISEHRFAPYKNRMSGNDELASELYRLDRIFSSALFKDISYIEVALRNALDRALTEDFGPNWWCSQIGFDQRVREHITDSWSRLPKRFTEKNVPRGERLKGRVIASCVFGTWSDMLDKGQNCSS